MAPNHKIALIQLHPKPLDPDFNFQKASKFIASAAAKGADLAVLPEYHLTGWQPESPEFVPLCGKWETYLRQYQNLARTHHICIVPGTIVQAVEEDPKTGEANGGAPSPQNPTLYNKTYFISHTGSILGDYTKKNLWHPERPHLSTLPFPPPSTSATSSPESSLSTPHIPILSTPLGPIGLLICWDLAFPEAFRALISEGARMVIIPTFWTLGDCSPYGLRQNPLSEKLFLESVLVARAFENTCAVVFVNAGAERKEGDGDGERGGDDLDYAGLSRVCMPFVGAVGSKGADDGGESGLLGREEGMRVVEIDMEFLDEAERNYKVREDIASEGWHYGYRI